MSEGTMQRRAQRDDQRVKREERPQRVSRLNRVLVCAAAVPVMLVAAGCSSSDSSSGSGDQDKAASGAGASTSSSASASPTVQAAAYAKLPQACGVLTQKTLQGLVPKGTKGKEGSSSDIATRASCSWSSLDNKGVKGSQFRWLNVALLRFDSDAARGSGDQQAHAYFTKQVQDARSTAGAQNTTSRPVAGTGDEATTVRYDLKKKEGDFKQQTVVARVENVVVTVDYNGAGLAGDKAPSADELTKAAEQAVKEAVASVAAANGDGSAPGGGTASKAPSGSPSASKPASPSASASRSATPSASASAAKKS
ncbi:DUF3558 domain-containing protein [Streptomyces sp. NPDC058733]|uniref:DUF3558 domain-containing protein n=2 Tax=unclassified Streptomyces TaxID=2593676 RepID=UPI00345722F1